MFAAGAPRWVSGLLAGVQAALLSLAVVVTPALAAYVATSADPANAEVGWPRSVAVGAALWLMGHGGPVRADGVTVTLVPLGITALALFAAYASARRSARPVRSAYAAGVGGYLAVVLLVTLAVGRTGPLAVGASGIARLVVGSALVAAAGLALGMAGPGDWRRAVRPHVLRVPALVRAGVRAGTIATAALVVLASGVAVAWTVSGRATASDVVAGLGLDSVSGVLLAVAQVSVAPNLVLWAMSWLAGPGFAVGSGTSFAPDAVVSGPLPALPLLGALPVHAGGLIAWSPLVVVAIGGVAGWWLRRRLAPGTWRTPFEAAAGTALVAGVLTAALAAASGGAVGPGRLAVVGPAALVVGGAVTLLVGAGVLVVVVPTDARVRAAVAALPGRARRRRSARRADRMARVEAEPGSSRAAVGTSAVADAATDDA